MLKAERTRNGIRERGGESAAAAVIFHLLHRESESLLDEGDRLAWIADGQDVERRGRNDRDDGSKRGVRAGSA